MALTDAALRKAGDGAILREGGLEFRFFAEGKAGVRFVGRVRGTNQRIAASAPRGSIPGTPARKQQRPNNGSWRSCWRSTSTR